MILKKIWVIVLFLNFFNIVQAEEVKPIKPNSREYKVRLNYTVFQISSNPFIVSTNRKKDILGEDTHYEYIEKVFIKNDNLLIVTWSDSIPKIIYSIYEINNFGELIDRHEVYFDDVSEIKINETPQKIQIFSEESKVNGKKFFYEFSNGKIFDFSTSMNQKLIEKEKERLCKGFYEELYTTYEYEYDPYNKVENIYDLGTANYSWISHKIKASPKLSDQLINTLKGKSLDERKKLNYINFKNIFCD